MSSEHSESLLLKKIREGDEYAFEIAFLKYYTPLCKYIWKYVRSESLAEEIIQEVFATVWETRFNLDPGGHLRGLLYEMARNKALDYIKHQKIVDQYIAEAKQERTETPHTTINFNESSKIPFVDEAREAVNDLPPRARQIYKLNREEGLTYKEIAGYLDISVKTVESHMRRVLKILRERLSKYLPFLFLIHDCM
ncbi:RNA polymerase sigma-70 factor, ECF subfamily [Fodinibius roseus]|uniref:RNA polymerase sigma-70 factor, ECF subfamily n=1 Tax=Fodinibius roseus TaxID=1194090 RepID=A0A1M4TTW4_9BACT|nr:RNA polymerase sigma-70 factor [Fodinibius roseus]SHE47856.1 RNA polymerase sigma-70 factor, ECF subfamily [Fodinibius roseus]